MGPIFSNIVAKLSELSLTAPPTQCLNKKFSDRFLRKLTEVIKESLDKENVSVRKIARNLTKFIRESCGDDLTNEQITEILDDLKLSFAKIIYIFPDDNIIDLVSSIYQTITDEIKNEVLTFSEKPYEAKNTRPSHQNFVETGKLDLTLVDAWSRFSRGFAASIGLATNFNDSITPYARALFSPIHKKESWLTLDIDTAIGLWGAFSTDEIMSDSAVAILSVQIFAGAKIVESSIFRIRAGLQIDPKVWAGINNSPMYYSFESTIYY